MTATATSSRTRIRHRRLFFVLIAASLAFAIWMQASRGDPRFVGAWRIAGLNRSADATITLNANGLGHWPRTLGGDLEHFPWAVQDGRFILGWAARRPEWWMVRDLFSKLTNRQDYPASLDLEIIEVTANHIILREASTKVDVTLTRDSN